jgi:hypothetical protein
MAMGLHKIDKALAHWETKTQDRGQMRSNRKANDQSAQQSGPDEALMEGSVPDASPRLVVYFCHGRPCSRVAMRYPRVLERRVSLCDDQYGRYGGEIQGEGEP